MKLISWNVNGLRACIQKGFLDAFDQLDADFFCLQETKLSEGQLDVTVIHCLLSPFRGSRLCGQGHAGSVHRGITRAYSTT